MTPACVIAGEVRACVIAGEVRVGEIDTLAAVDALASKAFASPKSKTLAVPSGRTLIFAGLRSRWTIPCSCAAPSASASCLAIANASSIGMAPPAI